MIFRFRWLFCLALALPAVRLALASSVGGDALWVGSTGITESVSDIMERQQSYHAPAVHPVRPRLGRGGGGMVMGPTLLSPASAAAEGLTTIPAAKRNSPQSLGLSYLGASFADTPGYYPPDSMGTAGPTQFLVTVNGRFRTFNKLTGVADGALNVDPDVFYASVLTPVTGTIVYNSTTDPRVRFDRLTNRWFITMVDIPTDSNYVSVNNRVLIAVSSGPTITSASSFTFFYFQQNLVSPAGDTDYFGDYPTLGIDRNALYVGLNMYTASNSFRGSSGFVVRKSSIVGSGPIIATALRQLCTATDTVNNPGPFTPQGVDNDDPASTEGYFVGVDNKNYGLLQVVRVSNPATSPAAAATMSVVIPNTYAPPLAPVLGSTCPLDTAEDRLFMAQMKLNPVTGVRTLWTAHQIGVDSTGTVGTAANWTPDRTAVRWYELKNLTATPALSQSGTLFDSTATNPRSYIYPSIAMSGQGHVALGCNTCGKAERVGVALTGRLNGDTLGTLKPVTMALTSTSGYNAETCTQAQPYQRWGDFSYTSVDPTDDMTMWTVQEYVTGTVSWGVRVIKLIAPPPASITSCNPSSLTAGATNASVIVNGTSANGSGFFDPGATFTNHITATISGTGVTVNSVVYNSPTQITLNVTIASGAAAGQRTLTVTNPDGQAVVSAPGVLTIASNAFTASDVVNALQIAGGLVIATPAQIARYGVVSGNAVAITDATMIWRKVMGLAPNP